MNHYYYCISESVFLQDMQLVSGAESFSISQILLLVSFYSYFIFCRNREFPNLVIELDALATWMKHGPRDFK